ncbi:MAG: outer membrane protein precursor-like protein [Ramlibacter sp.]|nr:outer membrane protein precursor-like protein [Ramlibacter sp.]
MWLQRTLLELVIGVVALSAVTAHAQGTLRWRSTGGNGATGLQADGAAFRVNLQMGAVDSYPLDRLLGSSQPQGLNVKLVGKTGWFSDVGVYGRVGTLTNRAMTRGGPDTSAMGYGVGVSWDFSPRATASVGWDTYDMRGASGDRDNIRGTTLGLRWRY